MSSPAPSTDPPARPDAGSAAAEPRGVVFDVERFATEDGPGIRTVVFLKGCPLRCAWCHNPESQNPEPERMAGADGGGPELCGRERTAGGVLEEALRDKPFYDNSGGGLTLSGGEPLARPAFALALLRGAKAAGLHVAVETSGAVARETILAAAPSVDLWLWDVKCLDPARHRELTGGELAPILANLEALDAAGADVVLRRPSIPGVNDDPAELAALGALAERLRAVRAVEILPYHPLGAGKAARLGREERPFPVPPPGYAARIAAAVARATRKPVSAPAGGDGAVTAGAGQTR